MSAVKSGDTVTVHYTGKLEDGTVFDSSKDRDPLEFTVGNGQVIPGFEQGVIGMEPGGSKTLTVAPDEGYGQVRKELLVEVRKTDFPKDITPEIGQRLQMQRPDGQQIQVTVAEMKEDMVTLDANHPLAGKTLVFDVELVKTD